jgi:TrmH family RNA methyltransferase
LSARTFDLGQVRSLRDRTNRDRTGLYFMEGVRFLVAASDAGEPIEALVVAPALLRSAVGQMVARRLRLRGVPTLRVSAQEFAALSRASEPQGVGAVMRQRWEALPARPPARDELWVACDRVRSPGNLGTLLRTCDAVGATGLVRTSDEVDPYDPGAVRASMGAMIRLRFVSTTLEALRAWRRRRDFVVVGATAEARCDYRSLSYRRPVMLVLGNERKGLSTAQRALCDQLVRIPMTGGGDSLNLAVAGSVLAYEVWQQRHPPAERR